MNYYLKIVQIIGPYLLKYWKFILGVAVGFLLCWFLSPPMKTTVETETEKKTETSAETANLKTAAKALTKTAKTKTDIRKIEERFRESGKLESRTTTETLTLSEIMLKLAETAKTTQTAKVVYVEKIVEKRVEVKAPPARTAGIGAEYTPFSGLTAISSAFEAFRVGLLALDVGAAIPFKPDFSGPDLERTAVRASVRFPLPF